ncbi:MAG: decaprenyl-phosphate phosphoribosyltransferase, partial [Solirubrobacteraceae bacterium]
HTVTPRMEASSTTADASRRAPLQAVLATVRPRQWVKNALVIAAAGAAGALGHDDVPVRVGLACLAFCLLSSGIYAINDVHDATEDRRHPRKRLRPVAARELDPRAATSLGVGLMIVGLMMCVEIRPALLLVGCGYVGLTLSYTLIWRRIAVLDVLAVAGGFVLRALAGGVAPPVRLSVWFVLVVSCAAVFVATGKRQSELARVDAGVRRRALAAYSPTILRLMLTGSAAVALFAYCVWAFELPTVDGIPWRPLTILPFAACLVRYHARVLSGDAEAPEDLLLRDRWLQFAGGLWLVVFALGVHAAG